VSATTFTNDIDNQNTTNYKYDKTGNLIEDVSESTRIHWTYYNKVKQIDSVKLTAPKYGLVWATKLRMKYDALGNRVVKENPKRKIKEVYVRDAQGNIFALYQVKNDSLYTKEFYICGSNRLGYFEDEVFLGRKCIGKWCNVLTPVLPVIPSTLSNSVGIVFGKKRYEISDWLGNVRVVINDRKTPINSGNATVGYKAQVINVNDYYSYGSTINERTYDYSSTKFRFAFNGKELDNEVYGFGNLYNFGDREYDSRLGRWWTTDKLSYLYPQYTPYRFAFNNPIFWVDKNGLIEWPLKGTSAINKHTNDDYRVNQPVYSKSLKTNVFQTGYFEGKESKEYINYKKKPDQNVIVRTSIHGIHRLSTKELPMTSPHIGIDYAAKEGTDVYSLGSGTVVSIDDKNGVLSIKYQDDIITFRHLSEISSDLKPGTEVFEGQIIAKTGKKNTKYPHLHIEARDKYGNLINPENRNYGKYTNEEFFNKYSGDYRNLPEYKSSRNKKENEVDNKK